jgi:signal transduction histidine kinase
MRVNDRPRISLHEIPLSDTVNFIAASTQDLATAPNLDVLTRCILDIFTRATDSRTGGLWIIDAHRGEFQRQGSLGTGSHGKLPSRLSERHPVPTLLTQHPHAMTIQQLSQYAEKTGSDAISEIMPVSPFGYVVPLAHDTQLAGFMILEPPIETCPDTRETLLLLQTLAHTAAIALGRMISKDAVRCASILMRRTDRLRSLEIMAGGFAHEVRNPLTSIKTFVQLTPERQHDTGFIREFSHIAIEDIHRIERLLQDILDYARYMVRTLTEEDINELVSSCLSFISLNVASRGVVLKTELAEQLPCVHVDRQQIKQVVINLLQNALDSLHDGSRKIAIRTRLEHKPDGDVHVCIEIQDDGQGIAAEQLEHIFDPFFTTKHSNGTTDAKGLGLTIAHQILREHQGELWVDSKQGVGSTFQISLPVHLRSS